MAVVNPAAGGERIFISGAPFKWQELGKTRTSYLCCRLLNSSTTVTEAWRVEGEKIPAGKIAYEPSKAAHRVEHSTEGESSLLGLKCRSLEETTRHMIHEFRCRGWV